MGRQDCGSGTAGLFRSVQVVHGTSSRGGYLVVNVRGRVGPALCIGGYIGRLGRKRGPGRLFSTFHACPLARSFTTAVYKFLVLISDPNIQGATGLGARSFLRHLAGECSCSTVSCRSYPGLVRAVGTLRSVYGVTISCFSRRPRIFHAGGVLRAEPRPVDPTGKHTRVGRVTGTVKLWADSQRGT